MRYLVLCFALLLLTPMLFAQVNYDESKVPAYTLPNVLAPPAGSPVSTAADWEKIVRPALLGVFSKEVFGITPPITLPLTFEVVEEDRQALGGKAIRKQIILRLGTTSKPVQLLLYVPLSSSTRPVPVFLGLNFGGNHTIHPDPAIRLPETWVPSWSDVPAPDGKATEAGRGTRARRWPVEQIITAGYGLATMYYGDIQPDAPDRFDEGIHPLFKSGNANERTPQEWGAVGAWAWGLSRALDYLVTDPLVRADQVAVVGHSRLGKAAVWAGAQDTRFALVVSNDSGEGGMAITRRLFGETISAITSRFPHWFCPAYTQYGGRPEALPIDYHQLAALMAPRPLYVASASEDLWADPRGEYLSAYQAGRVYALYGKKGLTSPEPPAVEQPVGLGGHVGYHIRNGKHDILRYDWTQFIRFADSHFRSGSR